MLTGCISLIPLAQFKLISTSITRTIKLPREEVRRDPRIQEMKNDTGISSSSRQRIFCFSGSCRSTFLFQALQNNDKITFLFDVLVSSGCKYCLVSISQRDKTVVHFC